LEDTDLFYTDHHLAHEVTSLQVFKRMRAARRAVRLSS
jgi:homoaconitase/3-isopropylmalate dehydratase large subunit